MIRTTFGRAVLAAERALRAEAAVVHDEGGAGVAAQELDLVVEAEAAAVARRRRRSPRAGRSGGRAPGYCCSMISTGGALEMPMVEQPLERPSWSALPP